MLNEHHNAPFCMQARTNMFGAILAAVTNRVKIVYPGQSAAADGKSRCSSRKSWR